MGLELTTLVWFAIGAGVTAGAFLIARSAVEITATGLAAVERKISRGEATRRTGAFAAVALAALLATALIAAIAVLAIFAGLLGTHG